jgi:hypothetical protein
MPSGCSGVYVEPKRFTPQRTLKGETLSVADAVVPETAKRRNYANTAASRASDEIATET